MDREPLGWTVRRHVVDVTFRELDPPRPRRPHRYLTVGQAPPVEPVERHDVSRVPAGGPPPAP